MGKERKAGTARKPPVPAEGHGVISEWMRRVMPDLQPIVAFLDGAIREAIPGLLFALKWKKAYYGLPDRGWIIELVAYDVSVNVVFLGGAAFDQPPALGAGQSRYVKVKTLEEAQAPEIRSWIERAGHTPGWR